MCQNHHLCFENKGVKLGEFSLKSVQWTDLSVYSYLSRLETIAIAMSRGTNESYTVEGKFHLCLYRTNIPPSQTPSQPGPAPQYLSPGPYGPSTDNNKDFFNLPALSSSPETGSLDRQTQKDLLIHWRYIAWEPDGWTHISTVNPCLSGTFGTLEISSR